MLKDYISPCDEAWLLLEKRTVHPLKLCWVDIRIYGFTRFHELMMHNFSVVPPNAQKGFFDCFFALRVQRPPRLLKSSSAHVFHCRIGPTSHHQLQYDSENCIANGARERRSTSSSAISSEETLKHGGSTFRACRLAPLHEIGFLLRDHWSPASQLTLHY